MVNFSYNWLSYILFHVCMILYFHFLCKYSYLNMSECFLKFFVFLKRCIQQRLFKNLIYPRNFLCYSGKMKIGDLMSNQWYGRNIISGILIFFLLPRYHEDTPDKGKRGPGVDQPKMLHNLLGAWFFFTIYGFVLLINR